MTITRQQAVAFGSKRYLGKPCDNGHGGVRFTSNSSCIECVRIYRAGNRWEEAKRWRAKHPELYRAIERKAKRKYMRERRKRDSAFHLKHILRSRLGKYLRGDCRISAVRHLGCTVEELRSHLEAQFAPGMTWENYGRGEGHRWEIDHIAPLVGFDLTDPEQSLRAVHYTNLQPLWAEDNLAKRERDKKTLKQE